MKFFGRKEGFSFVEVMAAAAVLAIGLVSIYRAFFVSLDYLNHITYLMHAMTFLDIRIEMIQKRFELSGEINLGQGNDLYKVVINNRPIDYSYSMAIHNVKDVDNIYQLDLTITWNEGGRTIRNSRSVYIFRTALN